MNDGLKGGNTTKYMYRDYRHIVRLAGLLVLGFAGSIALRYAAVPESYYVKGRYRAAWPEKLTSWNMRFAGQEACAECHEDKQQSIGSSKHKTLHCETCHWASAGHAGDPDIEPHRKVKPGGMREFCVTCHQRLTGRPAWFAQIDPADHNPDQPCSDCHQPHHPEMD